MSARLSFALVLLVMATSRFAIATWRLPTSYGIYLACRCTSGSRPASTTALCSTPTCCGKSDAGFPDVAIPPHLLPVLAGHLSKCVGPRVIRCCFRPRTADIWRRPRCTGVRQGPRRAGRPDLRFHELRHTGAVRAAATGATLTELMSRLGHSSPSAAMRYHHAASRDQAMRRRCHGSR